MSALVLASMLLAASPHAGDDARIGDRLKPVERISGMQVANAREANYRFFECAVARQPAMMRRVLDPGTPHDYEVARDAMYGTENCSMASYFGENASAVQLAIDNASMRGMIAEAVLKREHQLGTMTALGKSDSYHRDWFGRTGRPEGIDEMAVCIADTNPAAIDAMLGTGHGSKEEGVAFDALGPSIAACLRNGITLRANRLSLRSALAEAEYHRAFDPPPAAPAASGTKP